MDPIKEYTVITQYITGRQPTPVVISLFEKLGPVSLSGKELRLWQKCMRYPFLLPFVDAAVAWQKPLSGFRQHLLQRFAILESIPEYSGLFLPQKRSLLYFPVLACRAVLAAGKALAGTIIVLFL